MNTRVEGLSQEAKLLQAYTCDLPDPPGRFSGEKFICGKQSDGNFYVYAKQGHSLGESEVSIVLPPDVKTKRYVIGTEATATYMLTRPDGTYLLQMGVSGWVAIIVSADGTRVEGTFQFTTYTGKRIQNGSFDLVVATKSGAHPPLALD
ncbi:hypothetical protein [Pseudomonas helvetica]|uniref:hypothetical protein n=1 Tax=Pseudomonas helvetica TaxID=3136738 RepID=UPI0032668732